MSNHRFSGPYRQSLLKLYSQCPRKFKLLEVDGVEVEVEKSGPLLIGSLVHEILNNFHKTGSVDIKEGDVPEEVASEVFELTEEYIRNNAGLEVLHSEKEFSFNINSYPISGTIDLIFKDKQGRIVLRDLKTDSSEPSPEFLARDIQFSLYYLGAIRGLNLTPDLIEWYHVRNAIPYKRKTTKNGVQFQPGDARANPSISVSRKIEDIPEIEREIRYIIQGIRFNIFPMRPLKWGRICFCDSCDVSDYCKPMGAIVEQRNEFSELEGFQGYF